MLVDNGTIMQVFLSFYKEHYDEKVTDEVEKQQTLDRFEKEKHFGEKMSRRNKKPISEIETTSAIRSLNKISEPGPDGLTNFWYQGFEKKWAPVLKKLYFSMMLSKGTSCQPPWISQSSMFYPK